jgi:hypothetical protein
MEECNSSNKIDVAIFFALAPTLRISLYLSNYILVLYYPKTILYIYMYIAYQFFQSHIILHTETHRMVSIVEVDVEDAVIVMLIDHCCFPFSCILVYA